MIFSNYFSGLSFMKEVDSIYVIQLIFPACCQWECMSSFNSQFHFYQKYI